MIFLVKDYGQRYAKVQNAPVIYLIFINNQIESVNYYRHNGIGG